MKPTLNNIKKYFESSPKPQDLDAFFRWPSTIIEQLPATFTKSYYSPFKLVFLHKTGQPSVFQKELVYLARDGLFDLVSFFLRFPSPPKNCKSLFLFPQEFVKFIPQGWKKISFSYRYETKEPTLKIESRGIIGITHLNLDSIDELKLDIFLELSKKEEQNYLFLDDSVCEYTDKIYGFHRQNLQLKQKVLGKIGTTINFIEARQLHGLTCDSTWSFMSLDKHYLLFDDWTRHHFTNAGLKEITTLKLSEDEGLKLQVNPFEEIIVCEWAQNENYFNELFLEYKLINIDHDHFYHAFRLKLKSLLP